METTTHAVRPMGEALKKAKGWGFKENEEMSKFHNLERLKEWLYDEFSIWVWVQCNSNFEFTPYYIDLRTSEGKKQKCRKSMHHQEALCTGLKEAINQLN